MRGRLEQIEPFGRLKYALLNPEMHKAHIEGRLPQIVRVVARDYM